MAPKSTNTKKESGRAKKAENENKKKEAEAADKERKEAEKWNDGSRDNRAREEKEEKRRAELARKAEKARLLAEEEAATASKPKAAPKAGSKKKAAPKPAGPGAIAAGGGLASVSVEATPSTSSVGQEEIESFAATGIDDALELLETINAKKDKASVGQKAAAIEKHPERRFKAAFEAYQERELPNVRDEHPGLRLQQYKDLLFKQFQKSPENPFNQVVVDFDATKQEKVEALEKKQRQLEERLRDRTQALSLND